MTIWPPMAAKIHQPTHLFFSSETSGDVVRETGGYRGQIPRPKFQPEAALGTFPTPPFPGEAVQDAKSKHFRYCWYRPHCPRADFRCPCVVIDVYRYLTRFLFSSSNSTPPSLFSLLLSGPSDFFGPLWTRVGIEVGTG